MVRRNFIVLCGLLILTFVVNLNSLKNESFFSDDYSTIVNNPSIRSLTNIPYFFVSPSMVADIKIQQIVYRPLLMVSFTLNYFFGGLDTFGYRLVNLFFHLFNVILVYLIVRLITKQDLIALSSAALFGTHPISSEVVNFIYTRSSGMATFFYLLSFLIYIRGGLFTSNLFKDRGFWTNKYYIGSLIFFVLALFTKEIAITLPLIIVFYDQYFQKPDPKWKYKDRFKSYSPFFIISLAYVILRHELLKSEDRLSVAHTLHDNIFVPAQIAIYQLKLLIFPINLSINYLDLNPVPYLNLSSGTALIFLVLFISLLILTIKKHKEISFFLCWILITALPTTIGEMKVKLAFIHDHRLYLLALGLCGILPIIILKALLFAGKILKMDNFKKYYIVLLSLIVLSYSILYIERNSAWKDKVAIGMDMVEKYPNYGYSHYLLGNGYQEKGLIDKAFEEYGKALEIEPNYIPATINFSGILVQKGFLDEAMLGFKRVLKYRPSSHNAHFGLGYIYDKKGFYQQAIEEYETGLKYYPLHPKARVYLGDIYYKIGLTDLALDEYKKALEVDPDNPRLKNLLREIKKLQ